LHASFPFRTIPGYGVYTGTKPLKDDKILVLPVGEFVKRLYDGSIA
jgi:hypothetical protein